MIGKAIRDRYDGERRNPWNEFECGSNYARSMASYSLLIALSGFRYNMVEGKIGFNPLINRDNFRSFWSLHNSWGQFEHTEGSLTLTSYFDSLALNAFESDLLIDTEIESIHAGGDKIAFERCGNVITFNQTVHLQADSPLVVLMNGADTSMLFSGSSC